MCGICGFSVTIECSSELAIEKMLHTLQHRGPDNSGSFINNGFALGSALLSIVDIKRGKQPFVRKWKNELYVCVYNGEVYNYREIRKELESIGMEFVTDCDTEVVLAAYAAWGAESLRQFEGQWAFAVWESTQNRLFLARDPFGIKPLFYWSGKDSFVFASEPKAIYHYPGIKKQPNLDAIIEFFLHGFSFAAGYCSNHRSFYKDIHSLKPGHYLYWNKKENFQIKKYFEIPFGKSPPPKNKAQASNEIRILVEESVRRCLMGEGNIGVALSGGIDSSIIATIAADELKRQKNHPLLASCILYEDQNTNDDYRFASILASEIGKESINLKFSRMKLQDYLNSLDDMIWHFDEPHWEVKQIAMYNNYRTLKENGAKVVLSGEGADEVFLGYFHKFPGFLNPKIENSDVLRSLWQKRLPYIQRLFKQNMIKHAELLIDDGITNFYKPFDIQGLNATQKMQGWYLNTFLYWLLVANDRCSMAHSLEGRFPYLNENVFKYVLNVPVSWQIGSSYGQEKLTLRSAFKNLLPSKISNRAKAPLPSPLNLKYHAKISEALDLSIREVPASIWEILNKKEILKLLSEYVEIILQFNKRGKYEEGGEFLTSYLALKDSWQLRTPQIFSILTLLRWWILNFN